MGENVWNRFADAPMLYPNIPDRLRNARPAPENGNDCNLRKIPSRGPQDNEAREAELREALVDLAGKPAG